MDNRFRFHVTERVRQSCRVVGGRVLLSCAFMLAAPVVVGIVGLIRDDLRHEVGRWRRGGPSPVEVADWSKREDLTMDPNAAADLFGPSNADDALTASDVRDALDHAAATEAELSPGELAALRSLFEPSSTDATGDTTNDRAVVRYKAWLDSAFADLSESDRQQMREIHRQALRYHAATEAEFRRHLR